MSGYRLHIDSGWARRKGYEFDGFYVTQAPVLGDLCGISIKGQRPTELSLNIEIPDNEADKDKLRKWLFNDLLPAIGL